jgi:hypothetical protein
LHLLVGDLVAQLERGGAAGDDRRRGLLKVVHHTDEDVARQEADTGGDLVDGEGAGHDVEAGVAFAFVVVPDDLDRRLDAIDREIGRHALDGDLDAGLHLGADIGADARQGHEGAELDLLLGKDRAAGQNECGDADRKAAPHPGSDAHECSPSDRRSCNLRATGANISLAP